MFLSHLHFLSLCGLASALCHNDDVDGDQQALLQVRSVTGASSLHVRLGAVQAMATDSLLVSVDDFLASYKDAVRETSHFMQPSFAQVWAKTNLTRHGHSGGMNCDSGKVSALLPFEQWLIQDFPKQGTSTWGHLCFDTTQGSENSLPQALFILGLKALSNFNYDYCKFSFNKTIATQPDFIMAYWGKAMCETQLLWNSENPVFSSSVLNEGREMQARRNIKLNDREEAYYKAAEALNDYGRQWDECKQGIKQSMPCRFKAFSEANEAMFKAYPQDANTGAYVVLSRLALGAVVCTTSKPGECGPAEDARNMAEQLFSKPFYSTNPAFLHYSLHAFDYPYREIYERGLKFAERYPRVVNGSVHSLHMPSHIFQRVGNFSAAAMSDHHSVSAGDAFAMSGALKYAGGPVGSEDWDPGSTPSAYGFAYNAGNIYHSLEYEGYEVLQSCRVEYGASLVQRMGLVAYQAMEAGTVASVDLRSKTGTSFGKGWFDATTYYGWFYRMRARFMLESTFHKFLGNVSGQIESGIGQMSTQLPLPLAWTGTTDYPNSVYAPQSEAGLCNAIVLSLIYPAEKQIDALFRTAMKNWVEKNSNPEYLMSHSAHGDFDPQDNLIPRPWEGPCGGKETSEPTSKKCIVQMALRRMNEARLWYIGNKMWYEADLTRVLWCQVKSAAALDEGDLIKALNYARFANRIEINAVNKLLASSTSLYFVPGTAFAGILFLRIAQEMKDFNMPDQYVSGILQEAEEAFDACLAPTGRPNLSICLLGAGRAGRLIGQAGGMESKSRHVYDKLMKNWIEGSECGEAAQKYCELAWQETVDNLKT